MGVASGVEGAEERDMAGGGDGGRYIQTPWWKLSQSGVSKPQGVEQVDSWKFLHHQYVCVHCI